MQSALNLDLVPLPAAPSSLTLLELKAAHYDAGSLRPAHGATKYSDGDEDKALMAVIDMHIASSSRLYATLSLRPFTKEGERSLFLDSPANKIDPPSKVIYELLIYINSCVFQTLSRPSISMTYLVVVLAA